MPSYWVCMYLRRHGAGTGTQRTLAWPRRCFTFFSLSFQTSVGIPESSPRREEPLKACTSWIITRVMIDQDGKDEPISAYDMVSIQNAFC